MKKEKIVIVSTFFPPKNHIATRRISAFATYLKEYFDVIVITHTEKEDYIDFGSKDLKVFYLSNGFLDKILNLDNKKSFISRVFILIFRKIFTILNIEFYFSWQKKAEDLLSSIIEKENPKFILSSYMPASSHEACFNVLKNNNKIFWIADMRDEMSEHPSLTYNQRRHYINIEKKYSKRINLITSVSQPILKQFEKNMPEVKHFIEVRNGYDHAINLSYKKGKKLRLGYFGTFYGDIKPDNFFSALNMSNFKDKIEVFIACRAHNFEIPIELRANVKLMDFMPYEESIKMMGEMDANILILPLSNRKGVYSGKLFDYLSSNRPILGLVDSEDVAADLIREYNGDYLVKPDNIDDILVGLNKLFADWEAGRINVFKQNLDLLHRKQQVKKLVNFLTNVN